MTQQEAEVILKVNDQQARDKIDKLEKKAADLRQKFADAFRKGDVRGIDSINKELQKVNKEINNMRFNAANIRAAMVRLNEASPKELQRTIKLINNELNSGRVKRGTKEWDDYVRKLKEVQTELKKVKQEMEPDDDRSFFDKLKDGINDWGASAAAAAGALTGVVMAGKAAVQAYADMEAEEANVRKFTGMTAEEVETLNQQFKKMDTRTSRVELNQLAQEAGRLGKSSVEDVLGFVKAADQINVALDDLGDGATLTLSKLTGIFGDEEKYGTEQSLLKVGSVINELSQNCSASAPYIAEFTSRLGGVGAQAGMSVQQIMAYAAVLDSNNQKLEASSTALSQVIVRIYQDPAKYARVAGMDVQRFADLVKTDMNAALVEFLSTLNKAGNMDVLSPMFKDMGENGSRAISALSTLANHIGEVKSQQEVASEAFRQGTSVTNEFNVQNNTVQAQLDKAKKGFTEMAVALGKELLPVMRYCISGTSLLMKVLYAIVDFIVKNKGLVVTLTAAVAGYTIVVKASAVATALWNTTCKIVQGTAALMRTTVILLKLAYYQLTGQVSKAAAANRLFGQSCSASPLGIIIAAITTLIGLFISYRTRVNESRKAMAQAREEEMKWEKSLTDISEASAQAAAKEEAKLKDLYDAAVNQAKSTDQRRKAAQELQNLYPDYFRNMSTEQIMVGDAKDQYDKLRDSIIKTARARAAAAKIEENESQLLELEDQLNDKKKGQIVRQNQYDKAVNDKKEAERVHRPAVDAAATGDSREMNSKQIQDHVHALNKASEAVSNASVKLQEANKAVENIQNKITKIENANQNLADKYNVAATGSGKDSVSPDFNTESAYSAGGGAANSGNAGNSSGDKAMEALKKDLDERRNLYLKAEAENLTLYVTGQQSYAKYLDKKKELDVSYNDDVVKIHQKHNGIDIAAYGQALKTKADMLKRQEEEEEKQSLASIESNHKQNTDQITSTFFDPNSPDFQNKIILNQKLLDEDLRYIREKQRIYAKGSEEWLALEREYQDRNRQDQLEKQKETAQAMMQFEEQYRNASGSTRMQNELRLLDMLHQKKLISEKEYQKAKKNIKKKYEDEDKERLQERHSEYGDMLIDLHNALSDFLEDLANGEFNWDDFADAAEAAFSLMNAALAQYSAYSNAERDLELAKTEKRYDKEIAAAGKNTKKKKKLEEQKEAEIAKIKKKYNDRAMKIEIAQAIAQTAIAAINAYASGSKINVWLGPVAAALALAAGAAQIATIKKQHEAQAAGYYEGGFTSRDPNNRREVGVVHANEFVANHQAVANPALSPVLRLIDTAQKNNTVGSLTAADVSNALGQGAGVSARGEAGIASYDAAIGRGLALVAESNLATNRAVSRLSDSLDYGIEAKVILDGEDGFHKKYQHFLKLQDNPKR